MTPIISPWFIYLLSVVNPIKYVFTVFAVLAGIVLLMGIVGWFICDTEKEEFGENWLRLWKKIIIITTPVFILSLMLSIFLPSRNTLIEIYVTKHITMNNIKKGIEASKAARDEIKRDIIELINAVTNNSNKKVEEQ